MPKAKEELFIEEIKEVVRYFFPQARDKRQAMKELKTQLLREWYERNKHRFEEARKALEEKKPRRVRKPKIELKEASKEELAKILEEIFKTREKITLKELTNEIKSGKKIHVTQGKLKPILTGIKKSPNPFLDYKGTLKGDTFIFSKLKIDEEKFIEVLKEEYKKAIFASYLAPRAEISKVRSKVCSRLKINDEEFDARLLELNKKDPFRFQLEYGKAEGKGIPARGGIFHFLIIKE